MCFFNLTIEHQTKILENLMFFYFICAKCVWPPLCVYTHVQTGRASKPQEQEDAWELPCG